MLRPILSKMSIKIQPSSEITIMAITVMVTMDTTDTTDTTETTMDGLEVVAKEEANGVADGLEWVEAHSAVKVANNSNSSNRLTTLKDQ